MTTGVLATPLQRTGVVAAVSALCGAILVLAAVGAMHLANGGSQSSSASRGHDGSARVYSAPDHSFSIAVPAGWSALRGDALARLPGRPVALLRRGDGHGTVIVRRIPAVAGDLRAVARELTSQLEARVPGFRLVSARVGRVRAGGAFLYTFARGGGTAQTLAVTKVGSATYRLDTVVSAGTPAAAREAGAAVGSFGQ